MNFRAAVSLFKEKKESSDLLAEKICQELRLSEKINMMSGHYNPVGNTMFSLRAYNGTPIRGGGAWRLKVPPILFSDGPRGVVMGNSTCFPVAMARGASFDVNLEERVAEVIAKEMLSQGANYFAGICINLLRHPAWGRAQETYGEDPYLLGEMGAAAVRGIQKYGIMGCAKHFAMNSIENLRFKINVHADKRTLHEVYLPHFKRCVDENIASIMSAYNKVNGQYCGENEHLLNDILRDMWGFKGFVISDFVWGTYNSANSINNGLDMEMPFKKAYYKVRKNIRRGEVKIAAIDKCVKRIIRTLIEFYAVYDTTQSSLRDICQPSHVALAREVAVKSTVLLKNDGILPLSGSDDLLVVGELAREINTGDHGSSAVYPPYVISQLEGIQSISKSVRYDNGKNIDKAVDKAKKAKKIIMCLGMKHNDEGEYVINLKKKNQKNRMGGDRYSLRLKPHDVALIDAISAVNENIVVVISCGSAVIMEEWRDKVRGIIYSFYSGMEGGAALAELLFGKANFSAKLPFTIAMDEGDYPPFTFTDSEIEYGYYHGYTLLDKQKKQAAYPFGFGQSYTNYSYKNITATAKDNYIYVDAQITNDGDIDGEEIAQVYVGAIEPLVDMPIKTLKAFDKKMIKKGQTVHYSWQIKRDTLGYFDQAGEKFDCSHNHYMVYVGGNSRDLTAIEVSF